MGNALAVLVMSCDSYADAWQPFYLCFQKYWADCPFPVYFATEEEMCPFPAFQTIHTNKDIAWSARLLEALEKIPEPYILFMQEDFFLRFRVDNTRIQEAMHVTTQYKADMMRLYPCPPPQKTLPAYSYIGELDKYVPYRVSCQASIWKKETLQKITEPTETIHDFEQNATERSNAMNTLFLSYLRPEQNPMEIPYTRFPLHYLCTAIVKGKWTQDATQFCRQEGISLAHSNRERETKFDVWRRQVYLQTPKPLQGLVWRLLNNRFLN